MNPINTLKNEALELYTQIKDLKETADRFGVKITPYIKNAKLQKNYLDKASSEKQLKAIKMQLEVLTKATLLAITRGEINYFTAECEKRIAHLSDKSAFTPLLLDTEKKAQEALTTLQNGGNLTLNECQTHFDNYYLYFSSVPSQISKKLVLLEIIAAAKPDAIELIEQTKSTHST